MAGKDTGKAAAKRAEVEEGIPGKPTPQPPTVEEPTEVRGPLPPSRTRTHPRP